MTSVKVNIRSSDNDVELYRSLIASGQLPGRTPVETSNIEEYLRVSPSRAAAILLSLKEDGFVVTDARMKDSVADLSSAALDARLLEISLIETAAVCRQSYLPEEELPAAWQNISTDDEGLDKLQILSIWQSYLTEIVTANLNEMSVSQYDNLVSIALTYRLASMGTKAPTLSSLGNLGRAMARQNSERAMQLVRKHRDVPGTKRTAQRAKPLSAAPAAARASA